MSRHTNEKASLPLDYKRKFDILRAFSTQPSITVKELMDITGLPRTTLGRQLKSLRNMFDMDIQYVRDHKGSRGAAGYYHIRSWGIISPEKFDSFIKSMFGE